MEVNWYLTSFLFCHSFLFNLEGVTDDRRFNLSKFSFPFNLLLLFCWQDNLIQFTPKNSVTPFILPSLVPTIPLMCPLPFILPAPLGVFLYNYPYTKCCIIQTNEEACYAYKVNRFWPCAVYLVSFESSGYLTPRKPKYYQM